MRAASHHIARRAASSVSSSCLSNYAISSSNRSLWAVGIASTRGVASVAPPSTPVATTRRRRVKIAASVAAATSVGAAVLSKAYSSRSPPPLPPPRRPVHPVADKTAALRAVDEALGQRGPASIEYIFVNPLWREFRFPLLSMLFSMLTSQQTSQSAANPYGHALVRYRVPKEHPPIPVYCTPGDAKNGAPAAVGSRDNTENSSEATSLIHHATEGDTVCFNIVGAAGHHHMVNFLCPETYFFGGVDRLAQQAGAEQGGIDERSMVSVRLENVNDDSIRRMHEYFVGVQQAEDDKRAGYTMVFRHFYDFFRKVFPWIAERQNCAGWTSRGLVAAEVMAKPSSFPKLVLVRLLIQHAFRDPENVNVVFWGSRQREMPTSGSVAPFQWWLSQRFWRLEQFSNAMVDVADDGNVHVSVQSPQWKSFANSWQVWMARFETTGTTEARGTTGTTEASGTHAEAAGTTGTTAGSKKAKADYDAPYESSEANGAEVSDDQSTNTRTELAAPCLTHGDCEDAGVGTMTALKSTLKSHDGLLVFTRTTCGHGRRLQDLLTRSSIPFTVCNVNTVPLNQAIRDALEELTDVSTVPSVWVCNPAVPPRFIGGADETTLLVSNGELKTMLGLKASKGTH